MKTVINIVMMLFCISSFSQEQRVEYKKINNNLIKATYYFADNSEAIQREGFFNKNGKLQDTWISYDEQGEKTAVAIYDNGVKQGVWIYFQKDKINFVTYKDNKLINVEEKALVVN